MASPFLHVSSCLELCSTIVQQLMIAKHNKQECISLKTVIECIQGFLEKLPEDGLSDQGNKILEKMAETLNSSQAFLSKVTATGPLLSLLSAREVRADLMRFNRDLSNLFNMMGSGEKLVYLNIQRMQALQSVQGELKSTRTLFTEKEMVADRLSTTAAIAQQKDMHPEQLHSLLLTQLEQVEELSSLNPEELLQELQALQLEALYGGFDSQEGKLKLFWSSTEEFLVQQICAAYAPKAARANKPLAPAAIAEAPNDYLCPISREVMVDPVILCATGQTYESANIKYWLEQHSTCPATRQQLTSKQLVPNHALKAVITSWAREHGLRLPAAPAERSVIAVTRNLRSKEATITNPSISSSGYNDADIPAGSDIQITLPLHEGSVGPQQAANSSNVLDNTAATRAPEIDKDVLSLNVARPGRAWDTLRPSTWLAAAERAPGRVRCRCTRTLWAVGLLTFAVVAAVGLGVGIHYGLRQMHTNGNAAPSSISSPISPVPTSNTTTSAQSKNSTTSAAIPERNSATSSPAPAQQSYGPGGYSPSMWAAVSTGMRCGDGWLLFEDDEGVQRCCGSALVNGSNGTAECRRGACCRNGDTEGHGGTFCCLDGLDKAKCKDSVAEAPPYPTGSLGNCSNVMSKYCVGILADQNWRLYGMNVGGFCCGDKLQMAPAGYAVRCERSSDHHMADALCSLGLMGPNSTQGWGLCSRIHLAVTAGPVVAP